jgi:hypothetical protein
MIVIRNYNANKIGVFYIMENAKDVQIFLLIALHAHQVQFVQVALIVIIYIMISV